MHLWDFFLIHASPDERSAVELYELLRVQHRVFLDQARIKPGDVWWKKLDAALKSSRIIVVLVSPQLQQAHYASDEILAAIDLTRRQPDRRRVVPIFLDAREQCENAMVHYGLRPFQALDLAVEGEMPDVAKRLSCLARSLAAQAPLTTAAPVQEVAASAPSHALDSYPRHPLVPPDYVRRSIIEAYANFIPSAVAPQIVAEANALRKQADPVDPNITTINESYLTPPLGSSPFLYWSNVFREARLNGPRMVAALLLAVDAEQFPPRAKSDRVQLLEKLRHLTQ